jgi:hypothetical protein
MIDYTTVFLYSDQPVTCPVCGVRTDIILDLSHSKNCVQAHQCQNARCRKEFIVEQDNDSAI